MKVPKCKRCDGLLPPDENHVCEGYVPKYPDMDYEARDDAREDAAEFMEEERLEHIREARESVEFLDAESGWEEEA
jgi:hypothetical protein